MLDIQMGAILASLAIMPFTTTASVLVYHPGAGLPTTMQAVRCTAAVQKEGDFSTIVVQSIAVPKPGLGEVLINVSGSSVNPVDWKVILAGSGLPVRFPHTLGFDVSGTIAAVGPGTSRLKVGDAVWADLGELMPLHGGEIGSYAQFAIAEEQQVGLKPKTMSFSDAGTLPLVGFTTLQALRETGAPWANKPNLTVLVTAGAGGTGFIALQLARAYGAVRIVTAASKDQIAFCQQMGATQVVDYTKQEALDTVADNSVDIVYDNYGAPGTADKAMPKLKAGGVFILLPGKGGELSKHPRSDVKQINYGLCDPSHHDDLDTLAGLVDAGHLVAHVQQTFPYTNVPGAFNMSMAGGVAGKIAISVQ